MRYTDPSGHCPICISAAIGGAIRGAAGFGLYAITHQDNFNLSDALVTTGTGAVAGALIGSGVGAGTGIALADAMLVGAGVGAATNGVGYVSTHVDNFNGTTLVGESTIGAVTGAATALTSPLGTTADGLVSAEINIAGAELTYMYQQASEGQHMTLQGALLTGLTAGEGSLLSSGLGIVESGVTYGAARELGIGIATNPITDLFSPLLGDPIEIPWSNEW